MSTAYSVIISITIAVAWPGQRRCLSYRIMDTQPRSLPGMIQARIYHHWVNAVVLYIIAYLLGLNDSHRLQWNEALVVIIMNGNCYLRHAVGSFHAVNLQLYASLCLLRLRIKSVLYVYLLSRPLPDDIPFTSSRFHRFLLIQSSLSTLTFVSILSIVISIILIMLLYVYDVMVSSYNIMMTLI